MHAAEYLQSVLRTESLKPVIEITGPDTRLFHAIVGIATEAGELLDAMKKSVFYGKPFDRTNLVEEFGDVLWYLFVGMNACGLTLDMVMQANVDKLRARYRDRFDAAEALDRDLAAERAALAESTASER